MLEMRKLEISLFILLHHSKKNYFFCSNFCW